MKRKKINGKIKRIVNLGQYKDQLINLYIKCFKEAPWYENHKKSEVETWFNKMLSYENSILLIYYVVKDNYNHILGATFCFSAEFQKKIRDYIPKDVKREETIYIAETFVDSAYRRRGISSLLYERKISEAKKLGFNYAIETTSANSKMYPFMIKKGYKIVNREKKTVFNNKGFLINDQRVIFFKKI